MTSAAAGAVIAPGSPPVPSLAYRLLYDYTPAMLKIWPSSPAVADPNLTPRPGRDGRERANPFDGLGAPTAASASGYPGTPTFHHKLLHEPHTPLGHGSAPLSPTHMAFAQATTSLSLAAPDFPMNPPPAKRLSGGNAAVPTLEPAPKPPSALSATAPPPEAPATASKAASSAGAGPSSSRAPLGQIHVKLLAARGLRVPNARAVPYVLAEFEQNEFVSRDPVEPAGSEAKGAPVPLTRAPSAQGVPRAVPPPLARQSSHAMQTLGAISVRANAAAAAASKGRSSPGPPGSAPSSAGSAKGVSSVASSSGSSSAASSASAASVSTAATSLFGGRLSANNPVWKHEVSFDVTRQNSELTLTIYDRSSTEHTFLGYVQLRPVLKHDLNVDQWYKLHSYDERPVSGEMRVQVTFEQNKSRKALTPKDFEFLKLIGRGTFGRVFLVRKKDTKRIYAMKMLSKREIVAKKEVAHTIGERDILQRSLESPFLVGLKFSFQTDSDLFLCTDFKSGGELFWHLQRETKFTEERARFYVAELVLALEHLHKYDIVYRDLKPENILLDAAGHVALCDFGLSKANLRSGQLTQTFCGTTEYLAPEVLLDEHGYSKLVDFWSLGVLLFEMCCGWSPFYAEDTQTMYKNICFGRIRFPKGAIGDDGKQFVKALLNRNPKHRLGATRDAAELKEHAFFAGIDWAALAEKRVEPPFKPAVESDESVECFDPEFTSADIAAMGLGAPAGALDEDDPSEAWTAPRLDAIHTPNGPLGSESGSGFFSPGVLTPGVGPLSPVVSTLSRAPSPPPSETVTPPAKPAQAVAIAPSKKKPSVAAPGETPIPGSMFQGFTFSGGESLRAAVPPALAARAEAEAAAAPALLDGDGPSTEDELDDDRAPGGRYARARDPDALDV